MVYFVGLGAREVDDDGRLVVVVVGDVRKFAVSHYKCSSGRGEMAGHPDLPRVAGVVVVPEDLTWMNRRVYVREEFFLSRTENSGRVDVVHLLHSLRREDRIPCGTKVLHVASDDCMWSGSNMS